MARLNRSSRFLARERDSNVVASNPVKKRRPEGWRINSNSRGTLLIFIAGHVSIQSGHQRAAFESGYREADATGLRHRPASTSGIKRQKVARADPF